jgi:type II secretory pathway component GspD/PulD (secretin)
MRALIFLIICMIGSNFIVIAEDKPTLSGYYSIDVEKMLKDLEAIIEKSPGIKGIDLAKFKLSLEDQFLNTAVKIQDKVIRITNLYKDEAKPYTIINSVEKLFTIEFENREKIQLEIDTNKLLMKCKNENLPLIKITKEEYEKTLINIKINSGNKDKQNEVAIKIIHTENVPVAEIIRSLYSFVDNKTNDIGFYQGSGSKEFLLHGPWKKINFLVDLIKCLDEPRISKEENINKDRINEAILIKYEDKSIMIMHTMFVPIVDIIRALIPFFDKKLNDVEIFPLPSTNGIMFKLPTEKVDFFKRIVRIMDSPGVTREEFEKIDKNKREKINFESDIEFGKDSVKLIHAVYVPIAEMIRALNYFEKKDGYKYIFSQLPSTNGMLLIGQKEKTKLYLSMIKQLDVPKIAPEDFKKSVEKTNDFIDINQDNLFAKATQSIYVTSDIIVKRLEPFKDSAVLLPLKTNNCILIVGSKEKIDFLIEKIKTLDVLNEGK